MTNKIISIAAALMMGFTFSSFAGTPKEENKTEATEAKTESEISGEVAQPGVRYYFPISADGSIFTSTSVSTSQTTPQCEGSSLEYCASGLTSSQVTISGGVATVNPGVNPSNGDRTHRED